MSLLYAIFIIAYFLYVGIWNDFNNVLIEIPTNIFMFWPLVFAGRLLGMEKKQISVTKCVIPVTKCVIPVT
jgi:hypothetical protein